MSTTASEPHELLHALSALPAQLSAERAGLDATAAARQAQNIIDHDQEHLAQLRHQR